MAKPVYPIGGIAAGSLFVIPSFSVMLLLSCLAVAHIDIFDVTAAFCGIQPVVVSPRWLRRCRVSAGRHLSTAFSMPSPPWHLLPFTIWCLLGHRPVSSGTWWGNRHEY